MKSDFEIRGKLFFFPAVLPLAALLPWLLTAFGAVAGMALKLSKGKRTHWGMALLGISFAAGAMLLWPKFSLWLREDQTWVTLSGDLPKLEVFSPSPEPVTLEEKTYRGRLNNVWSKDLSKRPLSNPVRAGALVVMGTWEGTVDAYSLASGNPVWSIAKREPVFSLTLAEENLLLAGEGLHSSQVSSITAIRLPEGKVLWQREFKGHIESAPSYSRDRNLVWLSAGPGGLWCLNASTGAVIWHADLGHVDSTPLLESNLVLFSSQPEEAKKQSVFWALDQLTGKEVWRVELPGQPWGSPTLGAKGEWLMTSTGIGQVGVVNESDKGWAHKIFIQKTPHLAWSTELPGNPIETSRLISKEGLAVFLLTKGELLTVKTGSGEIAWRLPLGGPVQADPALSSNLDPPLLAVFETEGSLHLLDAATGVPITTSILDKGGSSSPLFLPDGLLVATPYKLNRYRW